MPESQISRHLAGYRLKSAALAITFLVSLTAGGCAVSPERTAGYGFTEPSSTKVFVIILDALKQKLLMDSLDELPNFNSLILGEDEPYPYQYFEKVLVAMPSASMPSNVTLLTGLYPDHHGVPYTLWFDRKKGRPVTLTSLFQNRVNKILDRRGTYTLFDFARESGKSTLAVTTQVTNGVNRPNWIQQSVHIWGQAFLLNFFKDGNPNPFGGHLDRRTTAGLLSGHIYSPSDGLSGIWRSKGELPDLTVIHYVGMDIFTHYPSKFMIDNGWTIEKIQKWYLKEVLDTEIGKITFFLKEKKVFDSAVFVFLSDHGMTRIEEFIDEKSLAKKLNEHFQVNDTTGQAAEADVFINPGAGTKMIYVKNRSYGNWMIPPRLEKDVKPVVDRLVQYPDLKKNLNYLLVSQYPGERQEKLREDDRFWTLDLEGYMSSEMAENDFSCHLRSLDHLDRLAGPELELARGYRREFVRENLPDIILINKPGRIFTPNKGKYAHHGGVYADDVFVSFVVAGPGSRRFWRRPHRISDTISTVDAVPMIAALADLRIGRPLDGQNMLPEFDGD